MIDITFPPVHYKIDGGCNCPSPDKDDNQKCKKCGGFLREEQKKKRDFKYGDRKYKGNQYGKK